MTGRHEIRKTGKGTMRLRKSSALILAVALCAAIASPASAQEWGYGFTWDPVVAVGDTKDFISKESYRGASFHSRKFREHTTWGFTAGWHVFDEQVEGTVSPEELQFEEKAVTITGKQFRYINAFPILLNWHLYLGGRDAGFRPFVGVNAGAYYIRQRLEVSTVAFEEKNWHWGGAPEAGFLLKAGLSTSIMVSARMNVAAGADNTIDHTWISGQVGFIYQPFYW